VKTTLIDSWLVLLNGEPIPEALAGQMEKIGVRDAVVIASESVDERPVWSPDGKYLAAKVDQKWIRVEPDRLTLKRADWRGGQPVGVAHPPPDPVTIDESMIRSWERNARFDPRRIKTRNGTVIELRQEDLGTQFVIIRKGSKREVLWTTAMENCHSLALSPDDKYVAFVCEQTGVVVATP